MGGGTGGGGALPPREGPRRASGPKNGPKTTFSESGVRRALIYYATPTDERTCVTDTCSISTEDPFPLCFSRTTSNNNNSPHGCVPGLLLSSSRGYHSVCPPTARRGIPLDCRAERVGVLSRTQAGGSGPDD